MVSKQLLRKAIAGLTGVAILGLSSLSFAGGEYAPAPAPAAAPVPVAEEAKGFYAGVRAGYGDNHWNKTKFIEASEKHLYNFKHTGFAGGVNVGYVFNKFFGLEAGYTYLPNSKITLKDVNSPFSFKVKNHAFDIAAKGTFAFPSVENVGVYGKVGVGFLTSKATTIDSSDVKVKPVKSSAHVAKLTYGAGAYWDVASNVRIDAGWQRFQGGSKKADVNKPNKLAYQPNSDVFMVGISYFFDGSNELFSS